MDRTGLKIDRLTGQKLTEEVAGAGALDLTGDLAVKLGGNTSDTARKNLTSLGSEFLQKVGVLVVHFCFWDVMTAVRHGAVSLPE